MSVVASRISRRLLVLAIVGAVALAGCATPMSDDDPDADHVMPAGDGHENAPRDDTAGDESGGDDNATGPDDGTSATDDGGVPSGAIGGDTRPAMDAGPQTVVALIDSGINPYHVEFRDDSALARTHPSAYVDNYPPDAQALRLTLDAPDLKAALAADAAVWESVEAGKLYWVPGTRIIGMLAVEKDGDRFGFDENGHGTMTASRAAGKSTSLAPTARIVAIEGLGVAGVRWAAAQPWIDVQSNSWVSITVGGDFGADTRQAFESAAESQLVLAASGNGLAHMLGAVGQPAVLGTTMGGAGVVAVGGHDNGDVTLWTGTVPHVVADACWNWAADASTIAGTGPKVGSGTSSSTPYVAGAAARIILEARTLLGDSRVSHEGGVFAKGPTGLVAAGPLADGDLTLAELKTLLFNTADPRPEPTPHDGDVCDLTMTPYQATPVPWAGVPESAPGYYFVGYGAVNVHTLDAALAILGGGGEIPARPTEDTFFMADSSVRSILP